MKNCRFDPLPRFYSFFAGLIFILGSQSLYIFGDDIIVILEIDDNAPIQDTQIKPLTGQPWHSFIAIQPMGDNKNVVECVKSVIENMDENVQTQECSETTLYILNNLPKSSRKIVAWSQACGDEDKEDNTSPPPTKITKLMANMLIDSATSLRNKQVHDDTHGKMHLIQSDSSESEADQASNVTAHISLADEEQTPQEPSVSGRDDSENADLPEKYGQLPSNYGYFSEGLGLLPDSFRFELTERKASGRNETIYYQLEPDEHTKWSGKPLHKKCWKRKLTNPSQNNICSLFRNLLICCGSPQESNPSSACPSLKEQIRRAGSNKNTIKHLTLSHSDDAIAINQLREMGVEGFTILGELTIENKIAEGKFGSVYKAFIDGKARL